MKRNLTAKATDRKVGITYEQLCDLVHECELSKVAGTTAQLHVVAGVRNQIKELTVTYSVFPSDEARAAGDPLDHTL
jgi:hypothetical protein